MTPVSISVMVLAAVVLVAALVLRKPIEKAGPKLIVPLFVLLLAAAALAAYSNHCAQQERPQEPAQGGGGGGGGGEGTGGGRAGWRERFKHTFALVALVRKLPLLDQQEAHALSPQQATQLMSMLAPLGSAEELGEERAQTLGTEAMAVLTPAQLAALEAIELPRMSRRGRRGRGRSTPAATETAAAATTATTSAPPERGGRERGRRDPNANPFLRDRYKPAMEALTSLLGKKSGGG